MAAALAFLATIVAVSALRADPPDPTPTTDSAPLVRPGEVTVPIPLTVRAIAEAVQPGDIVDLVTVDEGGDARLIAQRARIVDRPTTGTALTPTGAILLVAVPRARALALTAAASQAPLSVLIHPPDDPASLDSSP
ncbi:MAG TPA: hypothetical protein DCQ36_02455 [Actinobacteria bacterium]|jgi:hypothetical protein|nr:hypothetical protein [Actinomycetota bacterium]